MPIRTRKIIDPAALARLITLLDQKPVEEDDAELRRIATAVRCFNAVIGEDFLIAAFQHFLESQEGQTVEVSTVSLGSTDTQAREQARKHRHAGQADAWVQVTNAAHGSPILYLVEAKNWSARSLGGWFVPTALGQTIPADDLIARWNDQYFWFFLRPPHIGYQLQKIFYSYCPPAQWAGATPLRLLAVWDPVQPIGMQGCFGRTQVPVFSDDGSISAPQDLWVFSLSLYLRDLIAQGQSLVIDASRLYEKMGLISEFVGEIPELLSVRPATDQTILIVSITASWSLVQRRANRLWSCARGWWRCARERIPDIRHLVAVDQGLIVGIWPVTGTWGEQVPIEFRPLGTGAVFTTERPDGLHQILTSLGTNLVRGNPLPVDLSLYSSFRYA